MSIKISLLSPKGAKLDLGRANKIIEISNLDEFADIITSNHWAPATFALNGDGENRRRTIKNAEGVDTLVFDVDDGCTLDNAKLIFKPYKHIIVTSRNHQKKKGDKAPCDRFRVVLFLNERITDDQVYKATWFKLSKQFPFVDGACKDISRFYYAGEKIVSVQDKGHVIDIVKPELNAPKTPLTKVNNYGLGELGKETLKFLVHLAPSGQIHNAHVKALFDMREQRYSIDDAIERSMQAFASNGVEWTSKEEKRVEDIYHHRVVKHDARWPKQFRTRNGQYLPDPKEPDNYEYLCNLMGINLYRNEMDEQVYLDPEGDLPLENLLLDMICSRARKEGLMHSKEVLYQEINRVSSKNSFHPIKGRIDADKYDGEDYIGQLLETLEYDLDPELTKDERNDVYDTYDMYVKRWLIGCMAKLYRPGSQNLTLVLYGKQGIGKSRWLSKLPPWRRAYGEGTIDPANKDHELRHLDSFIWHIPELESVTGKREAGALKDYLTKSWVNVRPAFARQNRKGASICSFCASVNVESFLNDWTGNRRFLTIPLRAIHADHKVDTIKVWRQAKHLLDTGHRYWLNGKEIDELNELSRRFIQESPLDDILGRIEPGDDFMTAGEIFDRFEYHPKSVDYARLSTGLYKRGIPKVRRRVDGPQLRGYMVNKKTLGKS